MCPLQQIVCEKQIVNLKKCIHLYTIIYVNLQSIYISFTRCSDAIKSDRLFYDNT